MSHNNETSTRTLSAVQNEWLEFISAHEHDPSFSALRDFVRTEREQHVVHPPHEETFAALHLTPLATTRVVILGQDPYHGPRQAHGLAFSVRRPVAPPPSLRNIFLERESDTGIAPSAHGDLTHWARQGVLLLNTTLTVREGVAGSHAGHGWERFTDSVITRVNESDARVVFVLWGTHARQKKNLVTRSHHVVIESAHPSPLSARRGFFGSAPFSRTNRALSEAGRGVIDWSLPD